MAKFDYLIFTGGFTDSFVAHAKKFTKEEFVSLFNSEVAGFKIRKCKLSDIEERHVKYYVHPPDSCNANEFDGGCYSWANKGARGSFPVLCIDLDNDMEEK